METKHAGGYLNSPSKPIGSRWKPQSYSKYFKLRVSKAPCFGVLEELQMRDVPQGWDESREGDGGSSSKKALSID